MKAIKKHTADKLAETWVALDMLQSSIFSSVHPREERSSTLRLAKGLINAGEIMKVGSRSTKANLRLAQKIGSCTNSLNKAIGKREDLRAEVIEMIENK